MNITITIATVELCVALDDAGLGLCEASLNGMLAVIESAMKRRLARKRGFKDAVLTVGRDDATEHDDDSTMHEVVIGDAPDKATRLAEALAALQGKPSALWKQREAVMDLVPDCIEDALEALHDASLTTDRFNAYEDRFVAMLAAVREKEAAWDAEMRGDK